MGLAQILKIFLKYRYGSCTGKTAKEAIGRDPAWLADAVNGNPHRLNTLIQLLHEKNVLPKEFLLWLRDEFNRRDWELMDAKDRINDLRERLGYSEAHSKDLMISIAKKLKVPITDLKNEPAPGSQ